MYRNYMDMYGRDNYRRTRYNPYSSFRYDDYWSEWLSNYINYRYGYIRRNRRTATPVQPETTVQPDPPVVEAPKEELAKVLNVKKLDLKIKENTKKHRTDTYECTEDRKDDDGKDKTAEFVLRRGDSFDFTIEFDRPYDKEKHDMRLEFDYGDDPKPSDGTKITMKMDESGKASFKPQEWGAALSKKSGNSITVRVHIPCNVIVGVWDISVVTVSEGKDKEGKDVTLNFTYDHEKNITILFNPWCKDDTCYMATTDLLNEYVLNESGVQFQGSSYRIGTKAWNFGQFEDGVLEAALHVMDLGFGKKQIRMKGDAIKVSRKLAKMVNSTEGGILEGNWSGDYGEETKPWEWNGSVAILKEYMKDKSSVKYGQCWVFSGVLTTVCRALGLPCRSVTNFSSAHDTEESNTIDKVFDEDGEDITKLWSGDSVWNFHVWNEVWLCRPDLADSQKGMDGWQIIDATPQEASRAHDEVRSSYTCGPSPVRAIKTGNCRVSYDTSFVFSEVNADEVHWLGRVTPKKELLKTIKIKKTKIGKKISTKQPDGEPYPPPGYNPYRSRDLESVRLDLTNQYKFPEGSQEERQAVLHAHETARNPRPGAYDNPEFERDVKFQLLHSNDVMIGSPLPIDLKATNRSKEDKIIEKVTFIISPETYTGYRGKSFFKKEILNTRVPQGGEFTFSINLEASDYLDTMIKLEQPNMSIQVYSIVSKTDTHPVERSFKTHEFIFTLPGLDIVGPSTIKRGEKAKFEVSFKNPLDVPLTKVKLYVEGAAFRRFPSLKLRDIEPKGEIKETLELTNKRKYGRTVQFTLDTNELHDVNGAVNVIVE